jgi:hypothetical protein
MSEFKRNELINKTLAQFSGARASEPKEKIQNLNIPVLHRPLQNEGLDYYAEAESAGFYEKFKLIFPIIILAITCFLGYAWYTDKFAISRDNTGQLPVVKANTSPWREKPEDPGGMKIINRDKKIYDAISGKDNGKEPKTENILPAPEVPLSRSEISKISPSPSEILNTLPEKEPSKQPANEGESALTLADHQTTQISDKNNPPAENKIESGANSKQPTDSKANNATKIVASEGEAKTVPMQASEGLEKNITEKAILPHAEIINNTSAAEKPKKNAKAVTAEDVTDVAPKKKPAQPKKTITKPKGYKVQIGSYRVAGDAESSWRDVKNKFPDILSDLNDYIEKADLGDKGVYYRLQLTGFKSEAEARKVCQKLNNQKQGCFFVGK